MPDAILLNLEAEQLGYSAQDAILQSLLFGPTLLDETPEGPTRTWVYERGPASDAGCFEPVSHKNIKAVESGRAPAAPLIRIDVAGRHVHVRNRPSTPKRSAVWPTKQF